MLGAGPRSTLLTAKRAQQKLCSTLNLPFKVILNTVPPWHGPPFTVMP